MPAHRTDPEPPAESRLFNTDLAPVVATERTWRTYNLFALWMSDVHSVGGYVFAAGLFATGMTGVQVLLGMLLGILAVFGLIHLVALPSQRLGVPFPVVARISFGIYGANLPALVRAVVGIVWYGVQTHFASGSLQVILLRLAPGLSAWAEDSRGIAGLSWLGWGCYLCVWSLQLLLFRRGMESIRRFTDFAGPAVYGVMGLLAVWMVSRAGWGNIRLSLTGEALHGTAAWAGVGRVAALVVGYFAALLLNFGDFSRYCPDERQMIRGNLLGLPLNWMAFALVTAVVTSGTATVFGQAIFDPVAVVGRLDSTLAAVLGSVTFIVATVGINLVANFVSPAFDLSNLAPRRITFRTGGLIAAGAALVTLPWHFVRSPEAIAVFVGTLGGFLGPLYGILVVDYYLVKRGVVDVEALFSESRTGPFWYTAGWNLRAVGALVPAAGLSAAVSFVPGWAWLGPWNWFLSAAAGSLAYLSLHRLRRGN